MQSYSTLVSSVTSNHIPKKDASYVLISRRIPFSWIVGAFGVLTGVVYLVNIGANDFWNPTESFYAESVREMLESGEFLEIFYNYEHRFNKPPLTYWCMALFGWLFGISEFTLRLPIALMAVGSVALTYALGETLYDKITGFYSAVILAVSLQLFFTKDYAAPEMPLLFFFCLTLYFFVIGYQRHQWKYILFAYLSLGLTVLTKGFPYMIVIGGIVGAYLLLETRFSLKPFWLKVKFLKVHWGIILVTVVGLSWIALMYARHGETFWEVYQSETINRAIHKEWKGFESYFYYFEVMLWAMIPYSLAFYAAVAFYLMRPSKLYEIALPFSWLIVMLLIFSASRGKLPSYFIQAQPAIAILLAHFFRFELKDNSQWQKWVSPLLILPGIAATLGCFVIVFAMNLPIALAVIPCLFVGLWYALYRTEKKDKGYAYDSPLLYPSISMYAFFLVYVVGCLPEVGKFRPYDEIGNIIEEQQISPDIPLVIESRMIHNLPFYAKRKVIHKGRIEKMELQTPLSPTLILVNYSSWTRLGKPDYLWNGLVHKGSESKFFIFLNSIRKAKKGDTSNFDEYFLLYFPSENYISGVEK
jgi:4-amino-4-deoxy-L-arabinose transferase-like glycosyltransferase